MLSSASFDLRWHLPGFHVFSVWIEIFSKKFLLHPKYVFFFNYFLFLNFFLFSHVSYLKKRNDIISKNNFPHNRRSKWTKLLKVNYGIGILVNISTEDMLESEFVYSTD